MANRQAGGPRGRSRNPRRGERSRLQDVELWVPAFAWSTPSNRLATWDPRSQSVRFARHWSVHFEYHLIAANVEAVGHGLVLTSVRPELPVAVLNAIGLVAPRFDEILVAWQADWAPVPAPVTDPLVIGVVLDTCFLVDEFDLSKIERYIAAEYCVRPAQDRSGTGDGRES